MSETTIGTPKREDPLETAEVRLISGPTAPPPEPRSRQRFILVGCIFAVVIALVLTWRFSGNAGTQSDTAATTRDTTVRRTDFYRRLRVQGTVDAVSYQPIAAPRLSGPG